MSAGLGQRCAPRSYPRPEHQQHVDLSEWIRENFDGNDADTDTLAAEVPMLANLGHENPPGSAPHTLIRGLCRMVTLKLDARR